MKPLKTALADLRRDLADALAADVATPAPWRLEADRAALELTVALDAGAWRVVEAADILAHPDLAHRVTVEFTIDGAAGPGGSLVEPAHDPSVEVPFSRPLSGDDESSLTGRLAEVFGAPGFDSSARATVFREALEGLAISDILAAIAAAGRPANGGTGSDVQRAAHLVGRLLQRGPAGTARGRELLAGLFLHADPEEIFGLIARVWKTQDDWIDRSAEP